MANTKSYNDLESYNNNCVSIYRRSGSTSKSYHTRVRVPGHVGYVTKSCKTSDRDAAYRFAQDLFDELRIKVLAGQDITAKSTSFVIDEFLEAQAASKSPDRYRDINQTIGKHLRSYADKQKITWLDSRTISRYFSWRKKQTRHGRNPSENTLNSEGVEIKRFLRWCKDLKYLQEVPPFDLPKRKDIRRPAFSQKDWNTIVRHSRHWINAASHPSVVRDRTLLWNYCLVLANTGIRIGEARGICWKDIRMEPVAGSDDYRIIFNVSRKTGAREVVASRSEVLEYLQRIKALYDNPSPDDLVFAHRDGRLIQSFKKSFTSLTKYAGVEFNGEGHRHTIYSLRHTYATFRLGENVSVYALARNMGTSVRMIERFYGQNRTPDQADELTKMRNFNRTAKPILQMLDKF